MVALIVDVRSERLIHNWLQLCASWRRMWMGVDVGVSVSVSVDVCVWVWRMCVCLWMLCGRIWAAPGIFGPRGIISYFGMSWSLAESGCKHCSRVQKFLADAIFFDGMLKLLFTFICGEFLQLFLAPRTYVIRSLSTWCNWYNWYTCCN